MSFLAPAFLAGLLAVGIPLWLHRLSAENPNRKPFSSVMFLEAGEPQRVLAKKLQYLLLLAFRIAVIAILVFAFLQPAFWRDPAAGAAGDQRLHVIVMDTSASMAAGDRWDEATDAAVDLIDSSPVSDPVQVIAAGRLLEVVTDATLDKATARQTVQGLEPGVFAVNFGQLTRSLDGVLRVAELPVVLHFVTDAQVSGLPTRFSDLAPTESVEIQVHAVVSDSEPNWAVDGLFGSAQTGELSASVSSYAANAATRNLVLELNGEIVDEQSVTLEAGATSIVEFAPLTLANGANRAQVRLSPDDALDGDNVRMLALNNPVPYPVLVVSGDLRSTARDSRFIVEAMGVLEGVALEPTVITRTELADQDFSDYEFVIVTDAAVLNSDEADELAEYVENGGGVLLAAGSGSRGLAAMPVSEHEVTARQGQIFDAAADAVSVGDIDTSHPALAALDSIRSARYTEFLTLTETPEDQVLIRLQSGEPLLIERELGNGRLLVYSSSLDRSGNDLPKEPAFVAFVAGLADYLLGGSGFTNEAPLGSSLALQAMGMSGGQIFDPEGNSVLGLGNARTDVILEQVGFYELVGGGRSELVAVNFDARESDLAPASEATLLSWQELGRAAEDAPAVETTLTERVQVPVGYWLLLLVLLAAVVESGLGNWHLNVRRGIA